MRKAIRKEPEYRYASAIQLSEDIERYQSGLPLLARKETLRYRTGKFIRRHKTGLAAAILFLITAVGFIGFYTWKITEERNRVQLERDKSQQVANFLADLFRAGNPVEAQGDILTGLELLRRGVERTESLNDQPLIQAKMLYTIGRTYRSMNRPKEAPPLLEKALQLQRQYWQGDHPDIAHTLNSLGSVYWSDGKSEEAEPLFIEGYENLKRIDGIAGQYIQETVNHLITLYEE